MAIVGEKKTDAERAAILVCFAVKEEAKFFQPPLLPFHRVETLVTGMGADNAARAVSTALDKFTFALVLTCGFAGGLNPRLAAGAIVYSADAETDLVETLIELKASHASLHCARRVAVTSAEKQQLWKTTRADAVEMESNVIREICRARRISSATIRVISDAADEDLPLDFNAVMTADCRVNYSKLLLLVAAAPWKIPSLVAFQRQANGAARRLGECLNQLLRAKFDCA